MSHGIAAIRTFVAGSIAERGEGDAARLLGISVPTVRAVAEGRKSLVGAALKKVMALADGPFATTSTSRTVTTLRTADDLDAEIATVTRGVEAAARGYWSAGMALCRIFESKLYKTRKGEDGKPKYKSFPEWCAAEIGMGRTIAYGLMDIVKAYDAATIERVGRTKLMLTMRVAHADRPAMVEKAERGATVAELKEEARRIRREKGIEKIDTGRKPMPVGTKPPIGMSGMKPPSADKVTAVLVLKKIIVVPIFQADHKKKRMKRAGEAAAAEVELTNRVTMRIAVKFNTDGEMEVHLTPKRVDQGE